MTDTPIDSQRESRAEALPLTGIRVLELTHIAAGPTAGLVLADLGADVLKIEHPDGGDASRNNHSRGSTFYTLNRNKKSLALDLRTEEGRHVFLQLVQRYDIVINNLSPGALERLGLAYEWADSVNPRIIYLTINGFLDGPSANLPLLDELAQMMGGLAFTTGFAGQPLRAGASVIDMSAAAFGVIGLLAALHRRDSTGRGENVRSGLFETTVFFMSSQIASVQLTGEDPKPRAGRESGMGNFMSWGVYQLFSTKDERQVFIGVTSDRQWLALCDILDFADWANDPKYDNNDKRASVRVELAARVSDAVREWTFDEIVARLEAGGVPCAPVNSPKDLLDNRHMNEGGHWLSLDVPSFDGLKLANVPFTLNETDSTTTRRNAPRLGEHTDEVLLDVGFTEDEISSMKSNGIVRTTDQMLYVDDLSG